MVYEIIYYSSSDCCGAEKDGEGWECGTHSKWETYNIKYTDKAKAEKRAKHLPEGYVEEV